MSLFNAGRLLALLCFFTAAASAQIPQSADSAPEVLPMPNVGSPAAAEIQKINEKMTVLQTQLLMLDMQLKIAARKRELNAFNEDVSFSSFNAKKGNPSVVSVAGIKGQLEAVLVFPGGVTQRVKAGDVIDDRRVAQVSANEVVLTDLKGQKAQRLAFGNSPTIRDASTVQPAGSASPYAGSGLGISR